MNYLWFPFIAFLVPIPSYASTVTWKCNTESDMKQYIVEYTADSGVTYKEQAIVPHPKPCVKSVVYTDTLPATPGKEMYRVFAVNTSNEKSVASVSAPLAPPPPVASIGTIAAITVTNITDSTATVSYQEPSDGLGGIAQSNIRYSLGAMAWGSAINATCSAGVCQLSGLPADSIISVTGIGYITQATGGSKFGAFSPITTFKTAKAVVVVPPPSPPVPTITLQQALRESIQTCLNKSMVLRSCLTLLNTAIGKVTE